MTKFYTAHIECADGSYRSTPVAAKSYSAAYAHAKTLLDPGETLRGVTEDVAVSL